jgi:4-amino-4-deoxy-L-arabinose transferase-like glycosyltransferase
VPALVILIGMVLRLGMLGMDMRFHPDEALFAAQARLISSQGDVLLRSTDLDKPPLTLFVTALSFRILGPTEFAARLPNVLFSSLSLAVFYALAALLYRDRAAALLAVLLGALSPYDLAFAATAFTDVQGTFWVLAAALLAIRERWSYAGIAAALMIAAKSNAALFLALIVALALAHNAQQDWTIKDILRRVWRFALPLGIGIGLLVLWDMARAPRSFFSLGYVRNNPGRLIRSSEFWPRLERWAHWLGMITGSRALNGGLMAGAAIRLAAGALLSRSRTAIVDWLIAGYAVAFLAWHWLVAFNTYDRYLHTLAPFLLLLGARVLVSLWRMAGSRPGIFVALLALVTFSMAPAVIATLRGGAAVGGDQRQHTGIDALANFLNDHMRGQVVYDHWLGWELAYYLGETPQVTVVYSPLPEALANDMAAQSAAHYLVAPSPQHTASWIDMLHHAGVNAQVIYLNPAHQFVVYRLDHEVKGHSNAAEVPNKPRPH